MRMRPQHMPQTSQHPCPTTLAVAVAVVVVRVMAVGVIAVTVARRRQVAHISSMLERAHCSTSTTTTPAHLQGNRSSSPTRKFGTKRC